MLKTESKKIGAHTYKITQLGALKGRQAFARLARILGPAVAGMSDKSDVGTLLAKVAENLSDENLDYFCDLFAPMTAVTGGAYGNKEPQLDKVFDEHFAGAYIEMAQWLYAALEVNFGNFFGGLGLAASSAVPALAETKGSE